MSDSDTEHKVEQEEEEQVTDLSNSAVTTKYRMASDVCNQVLAAVVAALVPGADVAATCAMADDLIIEKCSGLFRNKRSIQKGVAFPCCLSINETVAHFSPLPGESVALAAGDSVKIDLGVHVDGFCAVVAHTYVVGEAAPAAPEGEAAGAGAAAPPAAPVAVTGPQADCLVAAYTAAEVASKLITPGGTNEAVTAAMNEVAESFEVTPVVGTITYATRQYALETDRAVALSTEPESRVDPITFELNEVYAIDVAMSTGEGRPRESEARTTVFKRDVERNYRLKMKASRGVLSEVDRRFPALPFSLRALEDERQGRLGVTECVTHGLLQPFPVVHEREGAHVAHVKFTVLLLPSGTVKITGMALQEGVTSDKQVTEATAAVLAQSTRRKNKKKKNKKKKSSAAASSE